MGVIKHHHSDGSERIYGNSRVFCGGRFLAGPDGKACIVSWLMVLAPSVVWQLSVGLFLTERYTCALQIFNGLLLVLSIGFLLATALSDPGIVPRQPDHSEKVDPVSGFARSKQPPRYFDTIVRSHGFRMKYCVTCNIYRPPRCTHCSVCENCVERFDHHCPWIGNCVGKRNNWLFFCFVTSTGTLNAFSLATAVAQLAVRTQEYADESGEGTADAFVKILTKEPLAVGLAIYCTLLVWFTVGLCLYHTYLISTNQTTYEQIKGVYSSSVSNPFNRGVLGNCSDALRSQVRRRLFDGKTGSVRWPTEVLRESNVPLAGGGSLATAAALAEYDKLAQKEDPIVPLVGKAALAAGSLVNEDNGPPPAAPDPPSSAPLIAPAVPLTPLVAATPGPTILGLSTDLNIVAPPVAATVPLRPTSPSRPVPQEGSPSAILTGLRPGMPIAANPAASE